MTYDSWKTTNPADEQLGSIEEGRMPLPDFMFTCHDSVVTVDAHSDAAIDYAWEHFQVERWQGSPDHFQTDGRAAAELAMRLVAEGWAVEEC